MDKALLILVFFPKKYSLECIKWHLPMYTLFFSQEVFFLKKKTVFGDIVNYLILHILSFSFAIWVQSIFVVISLTLDPQLVILKCGWLGILSTVVD